MRKGKPGNEQSEIKYLEWEIIQTFRDVQHVGGADEDVGIFYFKFIAMSKQSSQSHTATTRTIEGLLGYFVYTCSCKLTLLVVVCWKHCKKTRSFNTTFPKKKKHFNAIGLCRQLKLNS